MSDACVMNQIKIFAFLSNFFSFSFQVYAPRSLVAYAVKEVAKVYKFYDQDALSFVRNIDYHPLTITDSAPPEISIEDLRLCFCCINRQEQKRILESARHSLVKRRQAIDEIFDSIAKMVVNFGNKNEVDELDLKKLRVKTSNYLEIMDFLESVGVEVKLENMLEKMIGHIQQFRFRAKILNLLMNQSYLGYGEKVKDVESAGEGLKDDTKDEHNKSIGMEKVGGGFIAYANEERVNEERTQMKAEKTDLVVPDDVESVGDGVRKVGGGIAGLQEEDNEETNENFIEVTYLADSYYVKFAGYYPGDRLKIEEEYYNHSRNNGVEIVCGDNKADTNDLQENVNEERIEGGIEKTNLEMEEIVESAGDGMVSKGGCSLDNHQEKVNKEEMEEEIENTDLAVENDLASVGDGTIRAVEGSIAVYQKEAKKEWIEQDIIEVGHTVGDDEVSQGVRAIVGEGFIDQQKEVHEEKNEKEISEASQRVVGDMESAGDCLKLEIMESANDRERDLSEIKITMIEKEKAELAVENEGFHPGDWLKIGDMLGDYDRVGQQQMVLGSTTDNKVKLNKERKSVGKKDTNSTTGYERFNIDEEEDHFVLYGMIRCP